jgi:hypothetical protein
MHLEFPTFEDSNTLKINKWRPWGHIPIESFLHGLNNQSNMYGDEAKVIPSKQRQNIPALSAS